MLIRSKALTLIFIMILLITLSACDPATGASPPGDDFENPAATAEAGSGSATISYTYKIEQPPIFKLVVQPEIPLSIEPGENPGSYDVHGFGQAYANLEMMGGGGSGTCMLYCEVPVLYLADGSVELDEVNNDCKIPIKITRKFDHEQTIVTGDCPTVIMENFECSILFETLVDPNTYTFTKEFRELDMPADVGVILRAEIKNVIMPPGVEGICNW
jgi:hypothetical protein